VSTSIEWVRGEDGVEGATWNFARGCSRISAECTACYAERMAHRFSGKDQPYDGLTVLGKQGPRWTGEVRFIPEALSVPLKWRKPRRIFPCSMSDAFHESLTNEQIAAAFAIMAATPQHTYVMTTKRATRMRDWFAWVAREAEGDVPRGLLHNAIGLIYNDVHPGIQNHDTCTPLDVASEACCDLDGWPLPNVHLGVSAGTQESANERVLELLETPAAVRWVSVEPMLEPILLTRLRQDEVYTVDALTGDVWQGRTVDRGCSERLDWVVVGGESGPGARACDSSWIRGIIAQCKGAGTACFVKQLGTVAGLKDRKGADWLEWPNDLRVRDYPA